jgi:uncharacterized protein
MTRDRLLLFTRYPMPGQAKTRLIPALGAEGAADLQRQMTEHTLAQVKRLQVIRPVAVEIWFAGSGHNAGHNSDNDLDDRTRMADWLGADWVYQAQSQGDLGDRMANAFQAAFDQGMERVVVIGTDCPGLQADLMAQAFEALATQDLVLGDAIDGGYYLLGLRRSQPQLFMGIDWGAATVRSQTLEIAKRLGLAIGHLAPLADVDYPEDLSVWQNSQTRSPLSIIVPALNEAENLGKWQNLGDRTYFGRWRQHGSDRGASSATGADCHCVSTRTGEANESRRGDRPIRHSPLPPCRHSAPRAFPAADPRHSGPASGGRGSL